MRLSDGTVRKLRRSCSDPGCAHELTFTCFHGLPLLAHDRTRSWFVEALARARDRLELELWAYVIMPNHVHLLFCPKRNDYRIAPILQSIKQPVARRAIASMRTSHSPYLRRLRSSTRNGKEAFRFWQPGGGYDRNVVNPATAWKSVEYIHRNPVRKGLADNELDWIWSSARWYDGDTVVPIVMDAAPPQPRR